MKITYDKEVDALYVSFKKGRVQETKRLGANFLVDVDNKGNILGLEVLDASRSVSGNRERTRISIGNKSLFLPALTH